MRARPGAVASRSRTVMLVAAAGALWAGSLVLAVAPLAESEGLRLWDPWLSRIGATVATWLAITLVARRIGGPVPLIAALSGSCLAVAAAVPRGWILSGAAVAAAASYGLLGMVMTRPAAGLRSIREAFIGLLFGGAGAIAVSGYDVGLRPYRFRMAVLALTLLAALAIARRLALGFHSLGRRGVALIAGAVVVLVVSVIYVQLVRQWGSPQVVESLTGTKGTIRDLIGASPRPIEALVGFPALVWGVAVRNRRRQGWWMSAFGSLAAAGVATSLAQPSIALREAATATAYDVVIGVAIGLVLIAVDAVLTGGGRRSHPPRGVDQQRPEPTRAATLV